MKFKTSVGSLRISAIVKLKMRSELDAWFERVNKRISQRVITWIIKPQDGLNYESPQIGARLINGQAACHQRFDMPRSYFAIRDT